MSENYHPSVLKLPSLRHGDNFLEHFSDGSVIDAVPLRFLMRNSLSHMPTYAEHKRPDSAEVRCEQESLSPEFSHMPARNARRGVQLLDFTAPVCVKKRNLSSSSTRTEINAAIYSEERC